jgi:hypothetical protein
MNRQSRKRNSILLTFFCLGSYLFSPSALSGSSPLEIDIWLDRGDGGVYHSNDAMTIYFKVNHSSYVTIYNIDTDGYVNILYPYYPGMDNYVAGGKTYSIPGGGYEMSLYIEEPLGVGYIEAVASYEPFYLDEWPFLSHSYEPAEGVEIVRRITGDPFLSIDEINREILPFTEELVYSDDFAMYYVEEIVHYPRYLCSDCHAPSYYHHDPYYYSCPSYYIVVYDYWYYNNYCYWDFYYPYDYYGYYYRFPRSSHVGHRYSRKYDFRTREEGIYHSKGESTLSVGAIRVRDQVGSVARRSNPVTVSETGNVTRSSAVFRENTRVNELTGNLPLRTSHSTVREDAGNRSGGERASMRTEVEGVDSRGKSGTMARETVVEESRSSPGVRRVESRKVDGSDRDNRDDARTRSTKTISREGGGRVSGFRREETVSEGKNRIGAQPPKRPVRVEERRTSSSQDHSGRRVEQRSAGKSGNEISRRSSRESPGGRGRTEVRRSSARAGSQGSPGRGSGSRRPSFSR